MAMTTPICDFGRPAVEFALPDPEGQTISLADVRGADGTLVMFLCNHCPYVRAVIDRLVEDVRVLQSHGIGVVAVMANDWISYPDDAPGKMLEFAREHAFTFPYLIDETQSVARAYGAVCTPDFFGYDRNQRLQYRGRLDDSGMRPPRPGARRELLDAMLAVARTGRGPERQNPSIGCSIKWCTEV